MDKLIARALILLALSSARLWAAEADSQRLTIFAAASLTDVLQQVGAEYTNATRKQVRFSFAASSALARQIESGARADIFFSADEKWMDYLEARRLIDGSTRRNLLGNRLALIAPADTSTELELAADADLLAALGAAGRLATGDPDFVPVGQYAEWALKSLGVWRAVEARLVRAENVRAALMYVARGEAPLGIVYETDARIEPRVRIVDLFPESTHAPIVYPIAATATAPPAARSFLEFVGTPTASAIFTRAGFRMLERPRKEARSTRGAGARR